MPRRLVGKLVSNQMTLPIEQDDRGLYYYSKTLLPINKSDHDSTLEIDNQTFTVHFDEPLPLFKSKTQAAGAVPVIVGKLLCNNISVPIEQDTAGNLRTVSCGGQEMILGITCSDHDKMITVDDILWRVVIDAEYRGDRDPTFVSKLDHAQP